MSTSDLNASVIIQGGLQGGTEPWNRTTTLSVDLDGFRDTAGIGREGDAPGTLGIDQIKATLLESFDRMELCTLLDHLVALRKALAP
jgi:hypothetical protein